MLDVKGVRVLAAVLFNYGQAFQRLVVPQSLQALREAHFTSSKVVPEGGWS